MIPSPKDFFISYNQRDRPWAEVGFLNYCVDRRLLQRVGGRHRFLHPELLEHFARGRE